MVVIIAVVVIGIAREIGAATSAMIAEMIVSWTLAIIGPDMMIESITLLVSKSRGSKATGPAQRVAPTTSAGAKSASGVRSRGGEVIAAAVRVTLIWSSPLFGLAVVPQIYANGRSDRSSAELGQSGMSRSNIRSATRLHS